MPITGRSSKQVAKDRAALKRLRKSGIFRGKIDLRKAPSKTQLKRIAELRAKPKGKRAKQPLPPKQKTPGAKVRRTRLSAKQLEDFKPKAGGNPLTTYALPFLRKGQEEPEWRRFTRSGLAKFLYEYKTAQGDPEGAREWRQYAVKETWTFASKPERSAFKSDAEVYFSGVRIDEPQGKIVKRLKNKAPRKRRKRS